MSRIIFKEMKFILMACFHQGRLNKLNSIFSYVSYNKSHITRDTLSCTLKVHESTIAGRVEEIERTCCAFYWCLFQIIQCYFFIFTLFFPLCITIFFALLLCSVLAINTSNFGFRLKNGKPVRETCIECVNPLLRDGSDVRAVINRTVSPRTWR